jgi:coenzyme F420-reducing hydrogenase beta subunit
MKPDSEGFLYPEVCTETCVSCGLCRLACLVITPERLPKNFPNPQVFAAWNLDPEIRRQSSSGGVFTALAEESLARGGVVFGAGFDQQWTLRHTVAKNQEELARFRGSKYLQSNTGNVFSQIEDSLQQNHWVLFCGTPCQVAGLNAYLGKPYDALLTCDVVCHGVPSSKVFRKYVKSMIGNDSLNSFSFRDKRSGWKRYKISMTFSNGREYSLAASEDFFIKGFLRDIYLRPSCHACPSIGIPRQGDITLGDFWGIGNTRPDLDDDQGTSLILLNSRKGKAFFDQCKSKIFTEEVDLKTAIQGNPSLERSAQPHPDREKFFQDLDKMDFPALIQKYLPPPTLTQKIQQRILGLCQRLKRILKSKASNS